MILYNWRMAIMVMAFPEIRDCLPCEAITELCHRYDVEGLVVFGPVLRPDFGTESDVDSLVRFRDGDPGP